MSELSSSNCQQFSNLLISDLSRLCSFILSHPLHLSYLIFFSPFLLKLISFLSPLYITSFLLLLAFLAGFVRTESPQTRFASILERLQFKKDSPNEALHLSDDLGMFETVFGSPPMAAVTETEVSDFGENKVSIKPGNPCVAMEEKSLENFMKVLDEFEQLASNVEEMKKKLSESKKVVEKQKSFWMNGSEARNEGVEERSSSAAMTKSQSHRIVSCGDDGKLKARSESCRSMRGEREWERTLACKLLEERRSHVGGGEGMDSLWEAYEMAEFCKKKKNSRVERDDWEEEDEEEEMIGGEEVCCLQALKLSAGKVMLGVGKPNLLKISKAIKGFGWLHKTKTSKDKVHNVVNHRYY